MWACKLPCNFWGPKATYNMSIFVVLFWLSYKLIGIDEMQTFYLYYCLGLHAAELLTTNKLSELACLALYLMYEKKQGKKSFWYPYIRELDRQRGRGQLAVESPLLWTETELAYLTGSPTKVFNAVPTLSYRK